MNIIARTHFGARKEYIPMNETQNPLATRTLPVIALRGIVAFPHTTFRLDALSGSVLLAFSYAMEHNTSVLLLCHGNMLDEEPTNEDFFTVGAVAKVKKIVQNPDMSRSVIFDVLSRALVLDLTQGESFLMADIADLEEEIVLPADIAPEYIKRLRDLLRGYEILQREGAHSALMALETSDDIGRLCDYIAANLLNDFRRKQMLLDEVPVASRIASLCVRMAEEIEIAVCDAKIENVVRDSIEENHREYYLREQLKAIQAELGVEEDEEIQEYSEKIAASAFPEYVKAKLTKELGRLAKTPFGAAESTVLRNYLDICMEIPWGTRAEGETDVREAKTVLDEDHYGLQKVKDRVLEYIAVRQISPDVKGQILCLVGPPGVGKTSIAISVARAMKRPYGRISLGGVRDEADIRGHRKTYVGAMPGRIVDALTDAKAMNPVIILDEIDKLSASQLGDPAAALLEVLDPEQNSSFRDHFTEMPMDLSGCVFIATANSFDSIPAPLLDRMELIELTSYTDKEKLAIAQQHLIPKQLANHGLTKQQLRITEGALYEIIRHYTKEAGVRELERKVAAVCRKAAKKIAEGTAKSVTLSLSNIVSYLGNAKFLDEELCENDPVGIVNGLAYTTTGGDLLKVEVAVLDGTGKIELTGSLGEVMKESARIAVSYVRSIAVEYGISSDFYKQKDLHIHFPEGATPKDGPSAGVAMTCAIVSALTGITAKRDVAMTGEVTLHGTVLPIGGLKEKVMAAWRSGVKTVLIPRKNAPDLDEIDQEVRRELRFIYCDTAKDALVATLAGQPQRTLDGICIPIQTNSTRTTCQV